MRSMSSCRRSRGPLVALLAAGGVFAAAPAAPAAVVPAPGQVLPQGAWVTGPCKPGAPFRKPPPDPPPGLLLYHGDETYTRIGLREDASRRLPIINLPRERFPGAPPSCPTGKDAAIKVWDPGWWRMEVVHHVWDVIWGGFGLLRENESERIVQSVDFRVVKSPCTGRENTVERVVTKSGDDLGLPGTRLVPGQVISATAEDVDVDLEDGSVIRLKKGAKVRVDGCGKEGPRRPLTQRLSLLLGTIWAKVARGAFGDDRNFQVLTTRACACVRGTEFWLSYDPSRQRTTLRVVRGVVSFERRRPPARAIRVRSGRTAVQQGSGAPRFVRR